MGSYRQRCGWVGVMKNRRRQKSVGIPYIIPLIIPYYTLYTLSDRIGKVVASHAEGCWVDSRYRPYRFILCTRHSGGSAHEGRGATSQLDLPSLTPLSVAGCSRLQLGVHY